MKHGRCGTREYRAWATAKTRCFNPAIPQYYNYGGRGITMCSEWRDSFEAFLRDMGMCPPGMSLDRYPDTNGNYAPGNCRWATDVQQANNTRANHFIEWGGARATVAEWARTLGFTHDMLKRRLLLGWPVTKAFTTPLISDRKGYLTFDGTTRTVKEWSALTGLGMTTLQARIRKGWPINRVLTEPASYGPRHHL